MKTLSAIVVDDEPLARDELSFLLGECEGVEVVGQAQDAQEALELLEAKHPQVAFVDLRMPGPDGIVLAEALIRRKPELAVVMVSAHDEGAFRAYQAKIIDYLLKPVRLERLNESIERLRNLVSMGHETIAPLERLAVRRHGMLQVVSLPDVVYFEVRDELVWAVTEQERYSLDLSLAELELRVSNQEFFRSHRSALVRLDRIKAMQPSGAGTYELIMEHPEYPVLPLARERARLLRDKIPVMG